MTTNSQTTNVQTDNDNDNSYEKGTYPTITIIDSSDGRQGLALDDRSMNYCCVCIPEHVGVAAILSLYSLYGILSCIASFAGLTSNFFGILALRQDNVIAMRRISIAIWVITAFLFIYTTIDYIIEIVVKDESINRCQTELTGEENNIDCVQLINMFLIKEAFRVLFIEFFSVR
ncbi:7409_t:CDS:2 [Diversispora eburnea]|uniref:7409_t:CDS:1 n=1 Tax=Diversispora eburnea TaxID=1213867 RepID=A0A9N8YVT7_9GLOM|nr:7409_t:CDS:2 [Diversispora eburnea]